MSNKMALDALTAALDAMEHMANTLNNIDAVDEDEDAQHDAAFEAVRAAIAELEQPKKSRIVAASMDYYPESDQRFFNFWYGHMFEDLMQPPLVGIDHATARYIWNAAAIAALQAEPQLAPYLCIAPACGPKCSDCNSAISDATMRRYAIRYAWLRGHVGEMWAGSGFQWAARHDEIDHPADAAALDDAVDKAMTPLPATPPKD